MKHLKSYKLFESHKDEVDTIENIFYGFKKLPNYWVSDSDRIYNDNFFVGKEYEDFYFDNFKDMDAMFGGPTSLFGTKGLPVGHPKRTSMSFDTSHRRYGTAIVRVIKKTK